MKNGVYHQLESVIDMLESFKNKIETGEWEFVQATFTRPCIGNDGKTPIADVDWKTIRDTGVKIMTLIAYKPPNGPKDVSDAIVTAANNCA